MMQPETLQINYNNEDIKKTIGIIILPKNPLLIKERPFYLENFCGLSILERNIKILNKIGIEKIIILTNEDIVGLKNALDATIIKSKHVFIFKSFKEINEQFHYSEPKYIILMNGGALIDERIINSLLKYKEIIYIKGNNIVSNYKNHNKNSLLTCKLNLNYIKKIYQNNKISFDNLINLFSKNKHFHFHSTDDIPIYKPDMRRDVPLYVYYFNKIEDFKSIKKLLVKRTQKGTLDLVAWYFNRHFENFFVYILANTKITANHITYIVNVLGYLSLFLFLTQNWWIALILMVLINILDGVDGKLARLRMKESKVGYLEHSFDQLYEQAIYVGIGLGSYIIINEFYVIIILIIMLLADSFNRHCTMQYKEVMKITLADSSRFDQLFRRIDGRRNIYTMHILIFGLINHFEFAIFTICAHAIITSIIYSIQAIRNMKKSDKINS